MNVMSKIAADLSDRTPARTERHRLRIQAHGLINESGAAEFYIHDISCTGVLVETADALHSGDKVEFELLHAAAPPAVVVWSSGPFFGCSFVEPIAESLVRNVLLKDAAWSSGHVRADGQEDDTEDLAAQIIKIRQTNGLTAEEFANCIGVSRQAVWYWETGQRNPRAEQIRKIREEFGGGSEQFAPGRTSDHQSPSWHGASVRQNVADYKRAIATVLGVDTAQVRITIDW